MSEKWYCRLVNRNRDSFIYLSEENLKSVESENDFLAMVIQTSKEEEEMNRDDGVMDCENEAEEERHEKILYKRQAFADNYSGSQFLAGLRTNVTAVHYSFNEAVQGSAWPMLQMDIVILFVLLFEAVLSSKLSSDTLLYLGIAVVLIGYVTFHLLRWNSGERGEQLKDHGLMKDHGWTMVKDHGLTLIVTVSFGYGLTPIIRTLTETISTDTIYAMTCALLITSLFFHDYGIDAPVVSSALSFNLSLAGAVCLVSRVSDSPRAFAVLAAAQILFGHWPHLRRLLPSRLSLILLSFLGPISVWLLSRLSPVLALLLILLHFCVCLLCPFALMRMQPLKSTIHGPWDEATPLSSVTGKRTD